MKHTCNRSYLPLLTAVAGLAGLGLRAWLFFLTDDRGLLPAGHISSWILGILTLAVGVGLLLAVRPLNPVRKYCRMFPPSLPGAVGSAIAALGVLGHAIRQAAASNLFSLICLLLGILAAVSMGFAAYFRWKGKQPSVFPHAALALYLILHALFQCRQWGTEPQLVYYFYPLLACIFLMITAYQQAALTLLKGNRCNFVLVRMAALYFCCVSICSSSPLFYLSMAFWTGLDQCTLQCDREDV